MGGNITIDSVIGTGTTISFALPLIKVEKEDQNKKTKNIESKKLSYNLNKTSILLVEDNVNNQILATYIIEKYNGHCDIAENGGSSGKSFSEKLRLDFNGSSNA